MDTKALFKIQYGLFLLTAKDGTKDNGCIINTFMQVTANPLQVQVVINKSNFTTTLIEKTKKFNVSILSREADFSLFKRFGFQSGANVDKFIDFFGVKRATNDIYYLTEGTNAYFSCEVKETFDLGTHLMFIATVSEAEILSDKESLTYDLYQKEVKPKPQSEENKTGKVYWRCMVCGFEYEGDELPDDFICPICKHGKSDFEKIIK